MLQDTEFLESVCIGHRGNAGQDRPLLDDGFGRFADYLGNMSVFVYRDFRYLVHSLGVYQIGVHGIVGVVEADVPGAHAVLGLLVEVHADVQAVGGGQAVVVAPRYVVGLFGAAVGLDDDRPPLGNGEAASCVENPRSTYVDAVAEAVVHAEVDAVTPVVFVGKPPTVVDAAVRKASFAPGQCVRNPSCCIPHSTLGHQFQSVAASLTHLDLLFPMGGGTEEGDSVLIFQNVPHLLVVTFQREFPAGQTGVVGSGGVLVSIHGAYVPGDGYPQVGGHGEGGGRKQVDVLGHARIGGFGSETFAPVVSDRYAWLGGEIAFTLRAEQRGARPEVQAEPVGSFPAVFGVERQFHAPLRKVAVVGIGGVLPGGTVVHIADVRGRYARCEQVVDEFAAEADTVTGGRGEVEVGTQAPVADA